MAMIFGFLIAAVALALLFGSAVGALWLIDRWLGPSWQVIPPDSETVTIDGREYRIRNDIEVIDDDAELQDGCHLGGCLGKPPIRSDGE